MVHLRKSDRVADKAIYKHDSVSGLQGLYHRCLDLQRLLRYKETYGKDCTIEEGERREYEEAENFFENIISTI